MVKIMEFQNVEAEIVVGVIKHHISLCTKEETKSRHSVGFNKEPNSPDLGSRS